MKLNHIYVTFTEKNFSFDKGEVCKKRYAVRCDLEEQAQKIASEVLSLANCCNVRINRCGRLAKDLYQMSISEFYYRFT